MKYIEPEYVWNGELTKRTQPIYRIILHHAAASHCSAVQVHSWHKARADALNEVLSSKWRDLRGLEIVSFGVSSVKASEDDRD